MPRDIAPIHPGEILMEDFLEPFGITPSALARALGVPRMRISQIGRGERAITADTALRLGRYFGMEAEFWMNLQAHYDLETARDLLEERLDAEVLPRAA